MIAMALALEPKLMIADEPTTALDVTIQAQVLELISRLTTETGTSLILITHDLGVVAGMTDRINVMYAGFIVETATTGDLFERPSHPYTVGLLHSMPRLDAQEGEPLIPIEGRPPDMRREPPRLPVRAALRLARRALLERTTRRSSRSRPGRRSSRPARRQPTGSPATTRRLPDEAELGQPTRDGSRARARARGRDRRAGLAPPIGRRRVASRRRPSPCRRARPPAAVPADAAAGRGAAAPRGAGISRSFFPITRGPAVRAPRRRRPGGRRRRRSSSSAARRWASSASPAAARARPGARSSGSTSRPPARSCSTARTSARSTARPCGSSAGGSR